MEKKHTTGIIVTITAAALCLCIAAIGFSAELNGIMGGKGIKMDYETELFDTSRIMSVDILMDDDDWKDMLENALDEEYHVCDVIVNGTKFSNVAIRPKGNSSLAAIVYDTHTDRFSFKLEFDHFEEGQTCFGLDKLILNNNYADATNMKEAMVFDMYRFIGADASLYNYAKMSVNGDYRGVYLALEGVEKSFMLRNFGTEGKLYKPDLADKELADDARADEIAEFFNDVSGCDLNYAGDDLESYRYVWESSINGTGKKDHRRVVKAIKNINEGNDLERYLDMDNILKYMAVHEFSVNMDSLSAKSMPHNYYLYEYKGRLNIFPWDYNLSLGGMDAGGPVQTINDAIDTPFDGTHFFDKVLENDEYLARYHGYLQKLTDEYFGGGEFDRTYKRIKSQIDTLVMTDPTALYSYDRYLEAVDMFYRTMNLRSESIRGQLNGTIPTTESGQSHDPQSRIDASEIDLRVMGEVGDGSFTDAEIKAIEELRERRAAEEEEKARGDSQKFDLKKFLSVPKGQNTLIFSGCLVLMIISLVVMRFIKRKN